MKDNKYRKVRDHCHYTGEFIGSAHSLCKLKYSVPKKIPIAFHNGYNCYYHFIIKELAEEFKKQLNCLGENTEKQKAFTVSIEKEVTSADKSWEEFIKSITYILQFIDSVRFMANALSNLINNLFEGIHKIKCKCGHNDKKCETCGIRYKYCDCFLEYANFKDDLIECKSLCWNKSYQQKFDEKLKEWFLNTYKFSNHNNNKFILLLQKGVYPHEYLDNWEKFNEISLPEKDFYSHLNMEDITDADCVHAKGILKDFEITNLGEYHDLYVQIDTLLLPDVFENCRNMCLKIYELDPANFLSVPGLVWQAALKKTKVKLDLLSDIGMLLVVEKCIREGTCHSMLTGTWKIMIKIKVHHIFNIGM